MMTDSNSTNEHFTSLCRMCDNRCGINVFVENGRVVETGAGGPLAYVLHDLADLDLDPAAAAITMVVTGHTHEPRAEERDGVLYLNPGSAGPRRFRLPVTVAKVVIRGGTLEAELLEIVR